MFFRVKSAGSYQYLQIVHSIRQGEKVRQQVFGTLGRLDELKASGRLEALMRSGLRHCENLAVIDAHAAGETEAVRESESHSSKSPFHWRNVQKQPTRNTTAKKRARQEDVDFGSLFGNFSLHT
jgi:hypothetical protein